MNETKEGTDDLQEKLVQANIEKIELEIKELKSGERKTRFVKYIPSLASSVAVAGLLVGAYQFWAQQNERLRAESVASEREFKKALWEKQLNYYLEVAQAAATLASIRADEKESQPERVKARVRFWQLYYGELAVIEDRNVSKALVKYGRCLRDYEFLKTCDQNELKARARVLAQECRNAVARSWGEPLGPLERSGE